MPLTANVEARIAGPGKTVTFAGPPVIEGGQFGWGWQAGGGIGANVGPVSVDLNVTYRSIKTPATVSGSYYLIDDAGPTVDGPFVYESESILIRLTGFSVGIDVAFEM